MTMIDDEKLAEWRARMVRKHGAQYAAPAKSATAPSADVDYAAIRPDPSMIVHAHGTVEQAPSATPTQSPALAWADAMAAMTPVDVRALVAPPAVHGAPRGTLDDLAAALDAQLAGHGGSDPGW